VLSWRELANGRRGKAVVLAAAIMAAAGTARLGVWQLGRAAEKEALQLKLEARSGLPALTAEGLAQDPERVKEQEHRRVHLRGEWIASATVFLENRQMNGRPGFYVLTPLRLEGRSDAVMVQRGWAPRDLLDRRAVPQVGSPAGTVDVLGKLALPPSKMYELGESEPGRIRQNVELAEFSREIGVPLRPLSVMQADSPATAGDGLLREWYMPSLGLQKHHGYAFQWFALSALITGLYVWFQLIRPRRATPSATD
jgi:surfeit locus 1 family protein